MNLRLLSESTLHRCGPRGIAARFTFRQDCAVCIIRRRGRERRALESQVRRRTWAPPLTRAAKRWGAAGVIEGGRA